MLYPGKTNRFMSSPLSIHPLLYHEGVYALKIYALEKIKDTINASCFPIRQALYNIFKYFKSRESGLFGGVREMFYQILVVSITCVICGFSHIRLILPYLSNIYLYSGSTTPNNFR
ncbi:hypothetical protein TCON_1817 [Astathelohania contejeani]|uniref:Uncharacterized protein n=1 Tax=Astathelohania contejeani TaxID=164912 RepID=A0ABQ7HXS3_9MICR|nr:hypothetical protein TCON_1817 [Thelohania contejeani]